MLLIFIPQLSHLVGMEAKEAIFERWIKKKEILERGLEVNDKERVVGFIRISITKRKNSSNKLVLVLLILGTARSTGYQ